MRRRREDSSRNIVELEIENTGKNLTKDDMSEPLLTKPDVSDRSIVTESSSGRMRICYQCTLVPKISDHIPRIDVY